MQRSIQKKLHYDKTINQLETKEKTEYMPSYLLTIKPKLKNV